MHFPEANEPDVCLTALMDEHGEKATQEVSRLGVVVIGRNEGERLRRCLASLDSAGPAVVYVDSGSTDESVEMARSMGWDVVELDPSFPFSAARARNEGFEHLLQANPSLKAVQFIDGDCELVDGWLEHAQRELTERPDMAIVCGRVRERAPKSSIYCRLCNVEWDRPIGEVAACGGIAMVHVDAFRQVNGFDPTVIAGEDDELCFRLRQKGWKILRLKAEMALHDAAMKHFRQWWKRSVRAGHGFAEGAAMYGRTPERHWVRECRSTWFWGFIVPIVAVGMAWPTWGLSLALLLVYPLQVWRIFWGLRDRGIATKDASVYAIFCVAAKAPQFLGLLRYHISRLRGRQVQLIEHK